MKMNTPQLIEYFARKIGVAKAEHIHHTFHQREKEAAVSQAEAEAYETSAMMVLTKLALNRTRQLAETKKEEIQKEFYSNDY